MSAARRRAARGGGRTPRAPDPVPRTRTGRRYAPRTPDLTPPVEASNPSNYPRVTGNLAGAMDAAASPNTMPQYLTPPPMPVLRTFPTPSPFVVHQTTPPMALHQTTPGQTEGTATRAQSESLRRLSAPNPHILRGVATFAQQGPVAAAREATRNVADAYYTAGGTALGSAAGGLVGGGLGSTVGGAVGGALGKAVGRAAEGKALETAKSLFKRKQKRTTKVTAATRHQNKQAFEQLPFADKHDPNYEYLPKKTPGERTLPPGGSGPGPQAPFVSSVYQGNVAWHDDLPDAGAPVVAKPRSGTVRVAAFAPLVPRVRGVGRFAIDPNSGFPFAGVNKSAVRSMQRAMRTPGPQLVF